VALDFRPPKPAPPPGSLRRLAIPLLAVGAVAALVVVATNRWDVWASAAAVQTTDDATVRADWTQLSARVSGNVLRIAVRDFQRVRAGDLLMEIDPAEYEAAVAQAEAGVASVQAELDNLENRIALQRAGVEQAEAQRLSAIAREFQMRQEQARQAELVGRPAGTAQRLERATADHDTADATVMASAATVAARRRQVDVLEGQRRQLRANLLAARATLTSANLRLGYTRIIAPFDGVVGERQVQEGGHVNVGANLIVVVPLPDVYVTANYKETQLTRVASGQQVDVSVDVFPGEVLRARVALLSPASGSTFALLPPDNATGNFTKVVQRIPVRIEFQPGQPLVQRLRPGMSVVTRIRVTNDDPPVATAAAAPNQGTMRGP
jgi:membrane fusion protein, multidrug efflux system